MTASAEIRAAPNEGDLRRLWALLPRDRRRGAVRLLGLMLLGGLAELAAVGSVVPFLAVLTGQGAGAHPPLYLPFVPTSLAAVAALFIGAALTAAAIRLLLNWNTQRLAMGTGHWIAAEIHRRVLLQPYAYHVQLHSSTLISSLQKVQDLVWGVLLPALQGASAAMMAGLILVGLLWLDAWAALAAAACFAAIYAAVSLIVRRRVAGYSEVVGQAYEQRVRTLGETLGAIRDIIVAGSHEAHLEQFRSADHRLAEARVRLSFLGTAPRFVIEALGMVAIALLAVLLARREGGIVAALPLLGALALGAQRLLPLFQQVYHSWSALAGYRAVVRDLNQLLELRVRGAPAASTALPFESAITLEGVGFTYPGRSVPAVADLTVTIPKGSRVALTGRTGAGKSTAADLLMGLLEPSSGHILVDGRELTSGNRAAWQRNIAHVPQAIFLTDASIAENIAFGARTGEIDMAGLATAVRTAQLGETIDTLPQGLDTRVGERGVRLSGGQRQRLALARAIYRDKPLLVLDEATSALDDATEQAVLDALDQLQRRGVTIVIIAHRSSTLAGCDLIVRLEAGRIVAG